MAKRQFMSNPSASRDHRKQSVTGASRSPQKAPPQKEIGKPHTPLQKIDVELLLKPLGEIIENERERLSQAHSILRCLHTAMEDADEDAEDAPYFPDLIDMACKLVWRASHGLNSDHRRPIIDALTKAIRDRAAI
jgi:hypothetical protein